MCRRGGVEIFAPIRSIVNKKKKIKKFKKKKEKNMVMKYGGEVTFHKRWL